MTVSQLCIKLQSTDAAFLPSVTSLQGPPLYLLI